MLSAFWKHSRSACPPALVEQTELAAHTSVLFKDLGCNDYILQVNCSALIKETKRERVEAGGGRSLAWVTNALNFESFTYQRYFKSQSISIRGPHCTGGGAIGAQPIPPPGSVKIYGFHRVFRPKRVLNPQAPMERKKIKPQPPLDEFLCTPRCDLILSVQSKKLKKTLFFSEIDEQPL